MNKYFLAWIAAFALMTAGMFAGELWSQETLRGDSVITIPEGGDQYSSIEINMPGGGPVSGTYECLSEGTVVVWVLDGGQYDRFAAGQAHGSRFEGTGASGSFSIEQVDMERCYIVLFHGGAESAAQNARVTYRVDTMDSAKTWIGIVMLVTGFVILVATVVVQIRKKKASTPPPRYTDVVFFEEER